MNEQEALSRLSATLLSINVFTMGALLFFWVALHGFTMDEAIALALIILPITVPNAMVGLERMLSQRRNIEPKVVSVTQFSVIVSMGIPLFAGFVMVAMIVLKSFNCIEFLVAEIAIGLVEMWLGGLTGTIMKAWFGSSPLP